MSDTHREHRKRVKQEFCDHGMTHFPPHKALEMMLFYAISRRDTNPIAHRLIDRFGSLFNALNAPYELLLEVEGIGPEVATYLKALLSFNQYMMVDAYSKINVLETTEQAIDYVRYRFMSDSVECVLLVCLQNNNKVIYSRELARGTLEHVDIVPGDVIKTCLRANAAKAVLAHNHPGGFCNPSQKDKQTTIMLKGLLASVDVELVDHIIVASDGECSMKQLGML